MKDEKNFRPLFLFIITLLISFNYGSGQHESIFYSQTIKLDWKDNDSKVQGNFPEYFPFSFTSAEYYGTSQRIPYFFKHIDATRFEEISYEIRPIEVENLEIDPTLWIDLPRNDWNVTVEKSIAGKQNFVNFELTPIRIKDESIQLLKSFRIEIKGTPGQSSQYRNGEYAMISELNEGQFFKIPFIKSGLYKIDRAYFEELSLDIDAINPKAIQLFGNGGGMLPEVIDQPRTDDLAEVPLLFIGDDDTEFESGEYFIFYAEGPSVWKFNPEKSSYEFSRNIYETRNYYFLRTDGSNGLRIENRASLPTADYFSDQTDVPQVHEAERTNLLAQFDHTEGSGQSWYGESFFSTKEQEYISYFDFDDMILDEPVQFFVRFAARNGTSSTLGFELNGQRFTKSINSVNLGSVESTYARNGSIDNVVIAEEKINSVLVTTNAYQGWLDKIIINHREPLSFNGEPKVFSDRFSMDHQTANFSINSARNGMVIWDITKANEIFQQSFSSVNGNQYEINYPVDGLRRFVAFDPSEITDIPGKATAVENQNLHGIFEADMLIIYHDDFEEEVQMLANHRRTHNGFTVASVKVNKIYNEFSSGRTDPTAIRDFAKMVHDRYDGFKYLLLFGDGSYDFRSILHEQGNDFFVPVYETLESLQPIGAYVSDDYFGLLSDTEGFDLNGDLDIAVGRLPVRTAEQAQIIVDKIIEYETSPLNDGDWQNRIALLADDEDYSRHLDQTETVASYVEENFPEYNLEKIYFDAFKQEINPGGHRYPDVTKSINDNIFKGLLAMTYIGHGGPGGFAQERVLKLDDIYSWNNDYRLPLLITATCSFAGFDDPAINTAGEASILKENGGVIALFSTVRLVFSNENSKLINAVFKELFKKVDGKYQKIGDLLKNAKNSISNKDNKRKFLLFGDPAMQLAMPEYKVYTSSINNIDVTSQVFPDTLHALSKVKVKGFVGDQEGNIQADFNGTLYPTVFDKAKIIETLSNDSGSPKRSFISRKQILFKGAASVINGEFSFEFIIPKDIDYSFGEGKISYFYSNGDNRDANGFFSAFTIGGSSDTTIIDDEGPEIELFMNHTGFESGGITNNRPILLAHIQDETGINISGSSIGHDLGGMLDNDQQNYYRLNEFFESAVDDYTSGVITFPLDKLEPGIHTMYVEAWDLLNNKGEASIEFIVADEEEQVLKNIFNYPNPLSGSTAFYFEHTLPDTDMDVEVSIFDLSGRRVKVIRANAFTDGFRVQGIKWYGEDESANKVPNGIYIYTIKVISNVLGISVESPFEKLVIIK